MREMSIFAIEVIQKFPTHSMDICKQHSLDRIADNLKDLRNVRALRASECVPSQLFNGLYANTSNVSLTLCISPVIFHDKASVYAAQCYCQVSTTTRMFAVRLHAAQIGAEALVKQKFSETEQRMSILNEHYTAMEHE